MNKLMKKAAALLTAGLMAAASLGAEAFAESGSAARTSAVKVAYEATVAKPTYTIKGSSGVRKLKLSTTTPGATIYYTTNGTVPTVSSRKYANNTLLLIRKDVKIKAIAVYGSSQSAVMTKTIKVATKYGDVTGDGNINQNDYARLYNYFNGKTTFVCTDNADCNANGSLTRADMTILSQYLNGSIARLPYRNGVVEDEEDPEDPEEPENTSSSTTTVRLGKPGITVYKSLGGKKIEFTSSTSGVTFYYTLDGTTPTTKSTRYNGKFLISTSGTKTVKVIAYKNGSVSDVQQTTVTVGSTSSVSTSASTSQLYSGSAAISLSCPTSGSIIFYTTDGSDPRTSSTAKTYYSAFTITPQGNSTRVSVKTYARSKANADSNVSTFDYNFTDAFTLSGTVWNDTPGVASVADGYRASNETGISGIRVLALNTSTNSYVKETTTDSSGSYTLTGLQSNANYKVVFEFNGQKYRPYTSVVPNGNQALLTATIPAMSVRNSGAYNTSNMSMTNINNYNSAVTSNYFNTTATTSNTYRTTTNNINLALSSNIYGSLALSISSSAANNYSIKNNDRIVYTVTLTNNSPSAALSDVTLGFATTDTFVNYSMMNSNGYTVSTASDGVRNGYRYYTISNLLNNSSLAPGKSVSFTFTGYVQAVNGTKINCFAEVSAYRFATSVYDQYSTPGNMTPGTKRENDEAVSPVLTVTDSTASTTVNSTVSTATRSFTIGQGQTCDFDILITNISSTTDYIISPNIGPATLVTWAPTASQIGDNMLVHFSVKANTSNTQGTAYFTVYLKADTSVNTTVSVTVTR